MIRVTLIFQGGRAKTGKSPGRWPAPDPAPRRPPPGAVFLARSNWDGDEQRHKPNPERLESVPTVRYKPRSISPPGRAARCRQESPRPRRRRCSAVPAPQQPLTQTRSRRHPSSRPQNSRGMRLSIKRRPSLLDESLSVPFCIQSPTPQRPHAQTLGLRRRLPPTQRTATPDVPVLKTNTRSPA